MNQCEYKGKWQAKFIWFPKKVLGQLVWLKTVYRRRVIIIIDRGDHFEDGDLREIFEYSTIFDLIKNEEEPC